MKDPGFARGCEGRGLRRQVDPGEPYGAPGLTRRRLLAAAGLGTSAALAGCSSSYREKGVPATPSAGIASDSATILPPGEGTPAGVLSKQQVIDRFGARTPRAWALNLPGETVHVPADGHAVALTFDACGGPEGGGYDEKLIDLLRKHAVKATLMLNARWIAANESIAKELADDPLFRLGNHGVTHRPLSTTKRAAYRIPGTGSLGALYDEVRGAHDWITAHQRDATVYFRSGTAFSDDIGVDVCAAMGTPFLGFSLNGDAGATYTAAQVKHALLRVKAGDIVISHMNQPTHATARGYAAVVPQMIDHGVTFRHIDA